LGAGIAIQPALKGFGGANKFFPIFEGVGILKLCAAIISRLNMVFAAHMYLQLQH
jgi:hypothetical protein